MNGHIDYAPPAVRGRLPAFQDLNGPKRLPVPVADGLAELDRAVAENNAATARNVLDFRPLTALEEIASSEMAMLIHNWAKGAKRKDPA